jgi:hypothetical protein
MVKEGDAFAAAQLSYLGKKNVFYNCQDSKPWLEGYETEVSWTQGSAMLDTLRRTKTASADDKAGDKTCELLKPFFREAQPSHASWFPEGRAPQPLKSCVHKFERDGQNFRLWAITTSSGFNVFCLHFICHTQERERMYTAPQGLLCRQHYPAYIATTNQKRTES